MISRGVEISISGGVVAMVRVSGDSHPHTLYISCQQLLVGSTSTTHMVLWEGFYESQFNRKYTTTQLYRSDMQYQCWGRRGVL